MNSPILIPQHTWLNSPLSIARHYGGIRIEGHEFYIEGTDLVRHDFIPFLRKLGRDKFIAILKSTTAPLTPSTEQRVAQPPSDKEIKRLLKEALKDKASVHTAQVSQLSLFR